MSEAAKRLEEICAFCGKHSRDVSVLIMGQTAAICGGCIVWCVEIMNTRLSVVAIHQPQARFTEPVSQPTENAQPIEK